MSAYSNSLTFVHALQLWMIIYKIFKWNGYVSKGDDPVPEKFTAHLSDGRTFENDNTSTGSKFCPLTLHTSLFMTIFIVV